MRTTANQLTAAIARQTIFGVLVLFLAIPLLNVLHNALRERFGLGPPPASALIMMGVSVLVCFIGAGLIGVLCGGAMRGRGVAALVAALGALVWSGLVCSLVVPMYASSIAEGAATEAALSGVSDPRALYGRARDAVGGVREGRAEDVARNTASEFVGRGRDAALRAAARVPAVSLLLWTLIGPPLGAAFEAAKARRR